MCHDKPLKMNSHVFFTEVSTHLTMAAAKSTTITKWSCLICTYENQATSKLCEMCGTRQPGSTSGSDQDDNGWKCVLWYVYIIHFIPYQFNTHKPQYLRQSKLIQCMVCLHTSPNILSNNHFLQKHINNSCVCGAPSPLTNDLSGKQICASCTTINFANAHTCSVCIMLSQLDQTNILYPCTQPIQ